MNPILLLIVTVCALALPKGHQFLPMGLHERHQQRLIRLERQFGTFDKASSHINVNPVKRELDNARISFTHDESFQEVNAHKALREFKNRLMSSFKKSTEPANEALKGEEQVEEDQTTDSTWHLPSRIIIHEGHYLGSGDDKSFVDYIREHCKSGPGSKYPSDKLPEVVEEPIDEPIDEPVKDPTVETPTTSTKKQKIKELFRFSSIDKSLFDTSEFKQAVIDKFGIFTAQTDCDSDIFSAAAISLNGTAIEELIKAGHDRFP